MWASRTWICDACEKPASCLCVDCVAITPGSLRRSVRAPSRNDPSSGMEGAESRPGLVEVDVLAEVPDLLQNLPGVVDGAVVGALLDDRDADRAFLLPGVGALQARMTLELLADRLLVERRPVDRARPCRSRCGRLRGRSGWRPRRTARRDGSTCDCCDRRGRRPCCAAAPCSRPCSMTRCRSGRNTSGRRRRPWPRPAARASAGPSWISRSPSDTIALQMSSRKTFSPICS